MAANANAPPQVATTAQGELSAACYSRTDNLHGGRTWIVVSVITEKLKRNIPFRQHILDKARHWRLVGKVLENVDPGFCRCNNLSYAGFHSILPATDMVADDWTSIMPKGEDRNYLQVDEEILLMSDIARP